MVNFIHSQKLAKFMIYLILLFNFQSTAVQAGMVSTSAVIELDSQSFSTNDLLTSLNTEQLKQQLVDMGVDTDALEQRIASLTSEEISVLNNEIKNQPAGAGVAGLLVTVFIAFVITDAVCATDFFTFVKCVN